MRCRGNSTTVHSVASGASSIFDRIHFLVMPDEKLLQGGGLKPPLYPRREFVVKMAKGKNGKAAKQSPENSKTRASPRTSLKRKISSVEPDKHGSSTPSTPKRQAREIDETHGQSCVSQEVSKSQVCTNSSDKPASPGKGEFKCSLFGGDNWKKRHLRSMGKASEPLELPNTVKHSAVKHNSLIRKNTCVGQAHGDAAANTHIGSEVTDFAQTAVDLSKLELSNPNVTTAHIADTEASLQTPYSVITCNLSHHSAKLSEPSAPLSESMTMASQQNGMPTFKIIPEDGDDNASSPKLFAEGSKSAHKYNESLPDSGPQSVLNCQTDITDLEADSIARRLRKPKLKTETHTSAIDGGSRDCLKAQSELTQNETTSQQPQKNVPCEHVDFKQFHKENEPARLAKDEALIGDVKPNCEQNWPNGNASGCFASSVMPSSTGMGWPSAGEGKEKGILGSLGQCVKSEDNAQCEINKTSASKCSGAISQELHCGSRDTYQEPDTGPQGLNSNTISKEVCHEPSYNRPGIYMHESQPRTPFTPADKGSPHKIRQLRSQASKFAVGFTKKKTEMESVQRGVSVSKNQPLWNSTKVKLKFKMLKKNVLKKVPSSVKLMLSSGLLEGCPVQYVHRGGKVRLSGIIRAGGILCGCRLCKGDKVVSICCFEEHAGSTAKRPSDFITLENGKSLRDVFEASKGVAADRFPNAVRRAIDFSSIKQSYVCQKCKGPVRMSSRGKSNQLCQKCARSHWHRPKLQKQAGVRARPSINVLNPKVPEKHSVQAKIVQKDMTLHRIIFKPHGLPDGTELAYYVKGQRILNGYKQGPGICCSCCNNVVSCSQFEAHAGRASRRNPYNNIYLSDGQSLHEVALSLTSRKSLNAKINSNLSDNEDICTECGDGGELLLCDSCPKAFHTDCVGLSCIPRGDWYCTYCQDHSGSGRKVYVKSRCLGSSEKPIHRCTRVVKAPEKTVGGCVLCRLEDFTKSGFGARTVMLCDQCEKEFHVGCLRDRGMADLKELPEGEWFCCNDCRKIHIALQKLVAHGPENLPDSITERLRKKRLHKGVEEQARANVSWQLLCGKSRDPESRVLLSEATAIFGECFDPIIDLVTGRDLIPSMVYSRSVRDQDFGGMYCAVLIVDSVVVSAGVFRIFGREVAELPLIATSPRSQGQGHFQTLFSCIERLLRFLTVENLVLPAAEEAEFIWTKKFGFTKMSEEQFYEYRKDLQIMSFQGNSMLEKPLSRFSSAHTHFNEGI